MYNINEVSEVNTKYIFFHFSDDTQDRKTINKTDLKELYIDVCGKLKGYEFMVKECKKVYDSITIEYDKLEETIKGYKKYIEENQNDSSVRRGLHSVCFNLENTTDKQMKLVYNRSGVSQTKNFASDNIYKLEKLKRDIESVLRVI